MEGVNIGVPIQKSMYIWARTLCMDKIKFGTDGWRAIIAKDFTTNNVNRVSTAVSQWLLDSDLPKKVVIGHDCRFGGRLFLEEAARVFLAHGLTVYYADGPVTTPMVSMGTRHFEAGIGIVLTASHNPPSYNGYKLKAHFGGPLLPKDIEAIEARISGSTPLDQQPFAGDQLTCVDLVDLYVQAVVKTFDVEAIRQSPFRWGFDAMYGSGFRAMDLLFPEIDSLHCEWNPNFGHIAPEPILRNLQEFSDYIQTGKSIDCGLAVDGDADRIGLFDEDGKFVDSHHIILLLIHYMVHYKKMSGKVITAFSVTEKVKTLCKHYGLEQITTQIGFKNISGYFVTDDVLLGGEESGGIAVKGHIPERDGIWMGMILWEFMAKSGKSLKALIQEVYAITGSFSYDRLDLHLTEEKKQRAMDIMASRPAIIGGKEVRGVETIDGIKYLFDQDAWLLVRASGTEPVVRIYAETPTAEETRLFLDKVKIDLGLGEG